MWISDAEICNCNVWLFSTVKEENTKLITVFQTNSGYGKGKY